MSRYICPFCNNDMGDEDTWKLHLDHEVLAIEDWGNTKEDIREVLKDALQLFYRKDRNEIHISDLVYCNRKALFRKLDENPPPLSNAEVNNFATGRGIHGALEALVSEYPKRFGREFEVWFKDLVVAHIDIYDWFLDVPIEAKTYRVSTAKVAEHVSPAHQILQLKYYMAMTEREKGFLLGEYINEFNDFPFKLIPVTMTPAEIEAMREELFYRASRFKEAWDKKDPSMLDHVFADPDRRKMECSRCAYAQQCEQMRLKEWAALLKTAQANPDPPSEA